MGGALILAAGFGDVLTSRERPTATAVPIAVAQE